VPGCRRDEALLPIRSQAGSGRRRGPTPKGLLKQGQLKELSALIGQTERVCSTHPDDRYYLLLPDPKGWRSHAFGACSTTRSEALL